MAWLHATPKPPEGSKRAKANLPTHRLSRLDQMKRDGVTPQMPPNPLPHLISRLIEIGLTQPGGMGPVPLTWQEIAAWQQLTGVALSSWEARTIRHLSIAYLGETAKAESETCPPPWKPRVTAAEQDAELAGLRDVLG